MQRSVSIRQLKGERLPYEELKYECTSVTGPSDKSRVYFPCGLLANSMFTDKFSSLKNKDSGESLELKEEKLRWTELDDDFGTVGYNLDEIAPPPAWKEYLGRDYYESKEEASMMIKSLRFVSWINPAISSSFRKPIGMIKGPIKKGKYEIIINLSKIIIIKY